MKTTVSETATIPAWKARWNNIRDCEIEKARSLAEEQACKDIVNANHTIFYLLHQGESPAVKLSKNRFDVLCGESDNCKDRYASFSFDCTSSLCPDAKAEFLRVYHILMKREYGDLEFDKPYLLVPDSFASEYTPSINA